MRLEVLQARIPTFNHHLLGVPAFRIHCRGGGSCTRGGQKAKVLGLTSRFTEGLVLRIEMAGKLLMKIDLRPRVGAGNLLAGLPAMKDVISGAFEAQNQSDRTRAIPERLRLAESAPDEHGAVP